MLTRRWAALSRQLITTVFKCPAQILLDFDLDCCALAWDGARLLALPRSLAALRRRASVLRADLTAHCLARALKYKRRGWALAAPARMPGPGPSPRQIGDVMALAKLGLLLRLGVPLSESDVFGWFAAQYAQPFPRDGSLEAPNVAWLAGFSGPSLATATVDGGARGVTYAAGPSGRRLVAAEDAYDDDFLGGGNVIIVGRRAASQRQQQQQPSDPVAAVCALVNRLFSPPGAAPADVPRAATWTRRRASPPRWPAPPTTARHSPTSRTARRPPATTAAARSPRWT